jgi:hypothetical protein
MLGIAPEEPNNRPFHQSERKGLDRIFIVALLFCQFLKFREYMLGHSESKRTKSARLEPVETGHPFPYHVHTAIRRIVLGEVIG